MRFYNILDLTLCIIHKFELETFDYYLKIAKRDIFFKLKLVGFNLLLIPHNYG